MLVYLPKWTVFIQILVIGLNVHFQENKLHRIVCYMVFFMLLNLFFLICKNDLLMNHPWKCMLSVILLEPSGFLPMFLSLLFHHSSRIFRSFQWRWFFSIPLCYRPWGWKHQQEQYHLRIFQYPWRTRWEKETHVVYLYLTEGQNVLKCKCYPEKSTM